jgi:hypothetical protein
VAVVPVASLGTAAAPTVLTGALATYFDLAHTEGAWRNDGQLALTAGVFGLPSRVTLLEVGSNPGAPVNPTIITNIGGASAGVGFDGAGRLYTGNGFDLVVGGGQSQTGWIKAFEPALWAAGAADFEGSGVLIADVLSATDLVFDHEGNLAVGGGDFAAGDTGYLGLIEAGALAAAAMGGGGGGPVDLADAAAFTRLGPGGSPFDFYSAAFNPATGELHAALGDFASGANTWHATVPGPGGGAVLLIAGGLLGRRRAR